MDKIHENMYRIKIALFSTKESRIMLERLEQDINSTIVGLVNKSISVADVLGTNYTSVYSLIEFFPEVDNIEHHFGEFVNNFEIIKRIEISMTTLDNYLVDMTCMKAYETNRT